MNPAQLQKMMKQAQKLQSEMQNAQAELDRKEFTTTAGGNALTLVMTGDKRIVSITLNPEIVDPVIFVTFALLPVKDVILPFVLVNVFPVRFV